ncbi:YhcB family protein [Aliamphritea hakodatensis]|uniref:YhcB family protein n=1 Tax=Aliamphritea hakodatensis TaxID=2895352 RepID=UPI0022FD3BDD|nr:YhcB family protein [Aliamphritea hakodatensis]
MEDNSIWIISILTLVTGGVIGYFAGRFGTSATKQRDLNLQLEDSQRQLDAYKQQVNQHFERTAELVNDMTESYKAVHQHLATGSEALCDADTSKLEAAPIKPGIADQTEKAPAPAAEQPAPATEQSAAVNADADAKEAPAAETENIPAPPLDYAPKTPDQEGTLSENFGVKKEAEEPQPEPVPADHFADKKTEEAAKLH